jgi:hypothetical protein
MLICMEPNTLLMMLFFFISFFFYSYLMMLDAFPFPMKIIVRFGSNAYSLERYMTP